MDKGKSRSSQSIKLKDMELTNQFHIDPNAIHTKSRKYYNQVDNALNSFVSEPESNEQLPGILGLSKQIEGVLSELVKLEGKDSVVFISLTTRLANIMIEVLIREIDRAVDRMEADPSLLDRPIALNLRIKEPMFESFHGLGYIWTFPLEYGLWILGYAEKLPKDATYNENTYKPYYNKIIDTFRKLRKWGIEIRKPLFAPALTDKEFYAQCKGRTMLEYFIQRNPDSPLVEQANIEIAKYKKKERLSELKRKIGLFLFMLLGFASFALIIYALFR